MARKKPIKKQVQQEDVAIETPVATDKFILNKIDWAWVGFAVVTLITLIIRLQFIHVPFERDEGTYAYFGQLILDGKIPYVDFYEMKLPGIYYCYALIIAIFGATLEGIHVGMIVVNLLTGLFVFRAASVWFNKTTGVITALAFTFLSLNPYASGFTTQSEHFVAFFLSAGLLVLLKGVEKEDFKRYFISGVLFCFSLLVKQNGAFFMLFGGLFVTSHYLMNKSLDWKNAFLSGLIFTAGAIVPLVIVVLIVSMQGGWDGFVYWVYTYPQLYVGGIEWEPQGKMLLNLAYGNISGNMMGFIYLIFGGLLVTFFTKQAWHKKLSLLLFCLLSFASIAPGLRFYGHYWLYLMPAAAFAIGGFVYASESILIQYFKNKNLKYIPIAIFGFAVIQHWIKQGEDVRIKNYYTAPDETNILRSVYGQNPFPESKIIGDLIKANSVPEDKIAIFGSEPQLFIYTGLRGISKHNYMAYLVGDSKESAVFQKEFITDVEQNKPTFLVYYRHPVSWLTQAGADRTIYSWFDKFANENYQLIGLTQVLGPNNLFSKWGTQEALAALQDFRKQEQSLRTKLNELAKNPNQNAQAIANLKNQIQLFNFEIIVFKRKEV